jgi:hypothetical protein
MSELYEVRLIATVIAVVRADDPEAAIRKARSEAVSGDYDFAQAPPPRVITEEEAVPLRMQSRVVLG